VVMRSLHFAGGVVMSPQMSSITICPPPRLSAAGVRVDAVRGPLLGSLQRAISPAGRGCARKLDAKKLRLVPVTTTTRRIICLRSPYRSLSSDDGIECLYCPFCAATVFDDEDGMAQYFCSHVRLFVDWVQEANLPPEAPTDLADRLKEIDPSNPSELSALFGEDTVIFELTETGHGEGTTNLRVSSSSGRASGHLPLMIVRLGQRSAAIGVHAGFVTVASDL
jgi:hypothetical protein